MGHLPLLVFRPGPPAISPMLVSISDISEETVPDSDNQVQVNDTYRSLGLSVDMLSKGVAVGVALLYVCGFMIASLRNFQFGFFEMSPLRPRTLLAGGWFLLSIAIPMEFIRGLRNHRSLKSNEPWWYKSMELILAYYISCSLVFAWSNGIFNYDDYKASELSFLSSPTANLISIIGLCVGAITSMILYRRLPKFTRSALIGAYLLFEIVKSCDELIIRHKFFASANTVWLLAVGLYFLYEMRKRRFGFKFEDWPQSLFVLLGLLGMFAKFYYPHIKPEWGGGSPIPVTMSLSKEAISFPKQSFSCLLVDETDAGFYILESTDKIATFVPRIAVASVRFAGDSQSKSAK